MIKLNKKFEIKDIAEVVLWHLEKPSLSEYFQVRLDKLWLGSQAFIEYKRSMWSTQINFSSASLEFDLLQTEEVEFKDKILEFFELPFLKEQKSFVITTQRKYPDSYHVLMETPDLKVIKERVKRRGTFFRIWVRYGKSQWLKDALEAYLKPFNPEVTKHVVVGDLEDIHYRYYNKGKVYIEVEYMKESLDLQYVKGNEHVGI